MRSHGFTFRYVNQQPGMPNISKSLDAIDNCFCVFDSINDSMKAIVQIHAMFEELIANAN